MATCMRLSLVAACFVCLVSCRPVASLAPAPLDGHYIALIEDAMVEAAALSAGSQRADKPAEAVGRWRRSEAESEETAESEGQGTL